MRKKTHKEFKLINIIGVDGAGKTTLAKHLTERLGQEQPAVRYVYCQYFAKLLYPIKLLAKLTVMRHTNEFTNYKYYNQKKQTTSLKHPFLAGIYSTIWLIDYLLQIIFKVTLPRLMGHRLVVDRYIYDISVNLSLTSGRNMGYAKKLIDWLLLFSPKPDHVLFIDLPEKTAMKRKNDIQDIAYLEERRQRYQWLAQTYNFIVLDGSKSRKSVLEDALAAIESRPDSRKTILYVHANNRDIGGADYCLFKLASELDKTRYRPVVCLSQRTKILDLYHKEGIKTHVIEMERIKKSLSLPYLIKLAYKLPFTVQTLRKIIRHEKADLIHGNDLLDIYGPIAALLEKKPAIQYVRWILVGPPWLKKVITSLVYRLNTCVMTVSNAVAVQMFSKGGKVFDRVTTCYDWIDMARVGHRSRGGDIRKEYGISDTTPLVGCVGRLEHWKGQDVFIRAAAIVHKRIPEARFLIVGGEVKGRGRESFGQACRSLAGDLDIKDRVIFTGERKDIAHLMESLDVFVHSSVTPDPLPGVVMEAMACATPVVGADAGGVPEEMANRETGYLYRPGDPVKMAGKIIRLIENPSLAEKMGLAGQKRVNTVFDKTKLCRKIESVYENMIQIYPSEGRSRQTALSCAGTGNPTGKGDYHV